MLIDPQGLLYGERIRACSDEAQLHFPRLLAAGNSYGRFRMSVETLQNEVYGSFHCRPTKEVLIRILREYHQNFLLFVYKAADGSVWAQWDIPEKLLGRYRLSADRKSPAPPEREHAAFRAAYVESLRVKNQAIDDISAEFQNIPHVSADVRKVSETCESFQKVSHDVLVGVGVGVGVVKDSCVASSAPPAVIELSLVSGEMHPVTSVELERLRESYPAVDVMQQLRQMREWLIANPRNRKTSSGMARFIANWLAKEQNSARATPQPPKVVAPVRSVPDAKETALRLKNEYSERDAILANWRDLRQRDEHAYQAEAPGWVKVALAAEISRRGASQSYTVRQIKQWDKVVMARAWIARPRPNADVDREGYLLSFDTACEALGLDVDHEHLWMLEKIDSTADFDTDEAWRRVQYLTENPPDEAEEELFDAPRCVAVLDQGSLSHLMEAA